MFYLLRPATAADIPALYALHREALGWYVELTWGEWDDTFQEVHFREHFLSGRQVILCDDAVAGFLDIEERESDLWLGNIELAPAFQGQGVGALIIALQDRAAAAGRPVALQVLKVNPARRLYERLGFLISGETPTHHQMRWLPAEPAG